MVDLLGGRCNLQSLQLQAIFQESDDQAQGSSSRRG